MIGTAALLLVAPCATLAQAAPAAPTPALPADLVAAVQRDLGLSAAQYLAQAEAGRELATFADTLRGKFPTAFAGAWLDAAGTPLVGLADGPDKAAARTAVEAAGYQVKDQARSENTLREMLGQLNSWTQQLPAPLSGQINGAKIDAVRNDIALEVKDTAAGQGLQLPDSLSFVRVAQGPAQEPISPDLPGLGSLGSSGPTKPTEPTAESSTVTLDPITAAPDVNEYELTAKVTPAAAGGTVEFKDGTDVIGSTKVEADGTAVWIWSPETNGKHTITATFSGRDGVAGSTTTQQVTVTTAEGTTPQPDPDAFMGGDVYDFVDTSGGSHMCSLAFNATDASGHAAVLTAGHCDPADPSTAAPLRPRAHTRWSTAFAAIASAPPSRRQRAHSTTR
ncbi:Ig-like domain (group 3) [Rhodococcus maanshanensis]|uniref:Ig-like domain (Group 3) n=2 Tax=Rhodococcus maanshanensis TaxID=183556 RepID=A0A1H7RBK7_9NOCA|nr:Ig-like domain (group 3) [Rhodococcus maanshanensis]